MKDMNFSWVIPGRLAGSMGPVLKQDLLYLKSAGVGAIVRLERQTASGEQLGMADLAESVPDMQEPTMDQIDRILSFIDQQLEKDVPVAVSCRAGLGRTGTVLACYLVREGYGVREALDRVRGLRPGSVEAPTQQRFVYRYEERLRRVPS